MQDSRADDLRTDPDPFVLVGLAVAIVTMIAQLACIKIDLSPRKPSSALAEMYEKRRRDTLEKIIDGIEKAIIDVRKLVRLLSRSDGQPLAAAFRFGVAQAYVASTEFARLGDVVRALAQDVGSIGDKILDLVHEHPDTAHQLSKRLTDRFKDVRARIDGMYRGHMTNEEVLDECLTMLLSFQAMLDELDKHKN